MKHNVMSQNIETRLRERRKLHTMLLIALWVAVLLVITLLCSAGANAQMNNQQWNFAPQNRASIAALMQQIENDENTNAAAAATAGNVETLVCGGGGGSSSATANSSCIILNNSIAGLDLGQTSDGSQDVNNAASDDAVDSIADDVLETLAEE